MKHYQPTDAGKSLVGKLNERKLRTLTFIKNQYYVINRQVVIPIDVQITFFFQHWHFSGEYNNPIQKTSRF